MLPLAKASVLKLTAPTVPLPPGLIVLPLPAVRPPVTPEVPASVRCRRGQ